MHANTRASSAVSIVAGVQDQKELTKMQLYNETILLVEDEDSVREVASRILRRHGYTVIEASNGSEALREFGERGREFDLIITDIVMPEMGGLELAQRVREWAPAARILFTSG